MQPPASGISHTSRQKLLIHRAHLGSQQLVLAAIVGALGGLLFGYDNVVISGAIRYVGLYFGLGEVQIGWAAGCALLGCVAGAASAGAVADWLGLKRGLAICAVCFAVSAAGMWSVTSFPQFVIWRVIGGIGIGAASIIAPMYIAETAPAKLRGRLVTLYQFGIVTGILGAVFTNMLIQRLGDEAWNTSAGWRWMFFAGVFPAVFFFFSIITTVESPRWLMKVGRRSRAVQVLEKIYPPQEALAEAAAIEQSLAIEEGRFSELFTSFRRPLLIGMMLAGLSQISGITPLLSFLPGVFRAAGAATSNAFLQAVLVGMINVAFTAAALWLIDVAGRKTLILSGSALQCLSFALVGWLYHVHGPGQGILFFVMAFVAGHAFGNGAACWVVISEIYPTKVRGRAMSIATTTLWLVGYAGNQLFPVMQKYLGPDGTFWCFSAGALLTMFCVTFLVPETKGRTLEQITALWVRR
jgi:SP family arabinose:H+ symporter-like MFS transporter